MTPCFVAHPTTGEEVPIESPTGKLPFLSESSPEPPEYVESPDGAMIPVARRLRVRDRHARYCLRPTGAAAGRARMLQVVYAIRMFIVTLEDGNPYVTPPGRLTATFQSGTT